VKLKCPICLGCLDIAWTGNRRFYNCFLCQKTYDVTPTELRVIKEIVLTKDKNGNDFVERVIYSDTN
jgi:hypothetical protein